MPIKRRRDKSRSLDQFKIRELHRGPGSCLLAGCGYWEGDFYHRLDDEMQAMVRLDMREDWERHSATILQAFEDRTEHERYCDKGLKEPWALTEFGMPE